MRFQTIKELLLYRYRLTIGHVLFAIVCVLLLTWLLGNVPNGYSPKEITSAVASNNLAMLSPETWMQAPYHALQKITLFVFGVNEWGIRLPSVIFAIAAVVALYACLRRWFSDSIATVGGFIIVSSASFLLLGRMGTPDIMYLFWPSVLMLIATLVHSKVRRWRMLFVLGVLGFGFSLFTPFMLYFMLPSLFIFLAPENVRVWSELRKKYQIITSAVIAVFVAIFGWWIYTAPKQTLELLIGTSKINLETISNNIQNLSATLFNPIITSDQSALLWPYFGVPSIILGVYGMFWCARNIKRGLALALHGWIFISIVVFALFAPPAAIVALPLTLTVIIGLRMFIRKWYQLFPRNPYARISALIPLIVLVIVLVQFSAGRYFHGLPYSRLIQETYSNDITLLQKHLTNAPTAVIVASEDVPFYDLLRKKNDNLKVSNTYFAEKNYIIQEKAYMSLSAIDQETLSSGYKQQLVASGNEQDSLRFRIFTSNQ